MVGMAADWARAYNKLSRALEERRALLEGFGGMDLGLIQVASEEWLYMLQEDTRHSLAIEGYFTDERELRQVLSGRKEAAEVVNYFRTAQFVYEQGLQDALEDVWHLDLAFINNIHGQLFRNTPLEGERGKPADGVERRIQGAKVVPPLEATDYLRAFIQVSRTLLEGCPILEVLAKSHALFEAIHPYRDGNGRVGRLLLNYMAIRKGFPPLVIKGLDARDRERYYHALERADRGLQGSFPPPSPKALLRALDQGDWIPLALLLGESLIARLEKVVSLALMRLADLKPLDEVARDLDVSRQKLYVWAGRGRLVVYRPGSKERLLSHPWLFLGTREKPPIRPSELPPPRPDWRERVADLQRLLFHPDL
jgi:fido (protein-threonine AMPylation protein)